MSGPNPFERARYANGQSLEEASKKSGVSARTIARAEQGDSKPTAPVVKALSDCYSVPVAQLIGAEPFVEPALPVAEKAA